MLDDQVTISRSDLEILLWFAKLGDKANSQRRLRHGFRHVSVCSESPREPECTSCQAFDAADAVLRS